MTKALLSLRPDCTFSMANEDYSTLIYEGELPKPTLEELEAETDRLEAEFNALEYSRLREAEYAKLNQDEMRFDDFINGTSTWSDAILAIKEQYPKP